MPPADALERCVSEGAPESIHGDLVPPDQERVVIERLQAGDRTAFATLYRWYGEAIYRQAILPRLPWPEAAEDALRDTFRTALEKIGTYQIRDRSIFFWLHRIAVNKAIDVHRRRKRDHRLEQAVAEEPAEVLHQHPDRPDRGLELQDLRRDVEISLSRINERYARALRLRLLEDRPRQECAELLGVKIGTFDVLLHRAAKAFRKEYPP
jgi:RNA polymerase sigma factor (sigma-70 family)